METLFLEKRFAPVAVGVTWMAAMTSALVIVDGFSPGVMPLGFETTRQLIGVNLLLIIVPAYLLTAWGVMLRHSARLLAQVDQLTGGNVRARVMTPRSWIIAGATLGILYAVLFNLPIRSARDLVGHGPVLPVLVFSMILVWVTAGLALASRLHVSGLFQRAGEVVPLDPYDLTPLAPFARSGMSDVVLIVGVLILTTVQSIDATFRPQNYLYAVAVALPAGMILLLRPMLSIHRRLRAVHASELETVSRLIRATPRTLDAAVVSTLEMLLQRRDRIRALPAWPLDLAMTSRLVAYGVLPPLAWVTAAIVEQYLGEVLGGR